MFFFLFLNFFISKIPLERGAGEGASSAALREIHTLEFRESSFVYNKNSREVLCGVTLKLSKGEHLGIVGRTGAGKSSLGMALCGFLRKTRGALRLGERDLDSSPLEEIRSAISVLPQEGFIYEGTLRENLDPYL